MLVYVVIGVAGYLTYEGRVKGDFMLNYPDDDPLLCVCRFSFFPMREAFSSSRVHATCKFSEFLEAVRNAVRPMLDGPRLASH